MEANQYDAKTAIKNTFQNITGIYRESSKLLRDIEVHLEPEGFKCDHGNYLGTEFSKHIDNPVWFAPYLNRTYISNSYKDLFLCITIIFIGKDHIPVEPIIVFGYYKLREEKASTNRYNVLRHIWYHYLDNLTFNTLHLYHPTIEVDAILKEAKLMAKSLDSIKDFESIKAEITDPILGMLKA